MQRSNDAWNFSGIATITAYNGPSQTYAYDDAYCFIGSVYYRLKILSQDGKVEYSRVVNLVGKAGMIIRVLPNPVQSFATIRMDDIDLLLTEILIIDSKGSRVLKQKINSMNQLISLEPLVPGMYIIQFANGETRKLIKN